MQQCLFVTRCLESMFEENHSFKGPLFLPGWPGVLCALHGAFVPCVDSIQHYYFLDEYRKFSKIKILAFC